MSPVVDVCGRYVLERLVVALVVVVGDDVYDGRLEVPREVVLELEGSTWSAVPRLTVVPSMPQTR